METRSDAPSLEAYGLSLPGTNASCPFGDEVLVLKLLDKMFALLTIGSPQPAISLKCDPMLAGDLRRDYPAVKPGYHLNKQHWNTVTLDGSIPDAELKRWIVHSYELIKKKLPKATRETL
ncbi:MAG: MmcQ/YjbR family DNA-binding protein [Bacteroidota bacterium]